MIASDLTGATWHKSSRSTGGGNGDCVECALNLPGIVAVRDSKDPDGAALVFSSGSWVAFALAVRAGEFDR